MVAAFIRLKSRLGQVLWAFAIVFFFGAALVWTRAASVEKKASEAISLARRSREQTKQMIANAAPTPKPAASEKARAKRGPKDKAPDKAADKSEGKVDGKEIAAAKPTPSTGLPVEMEDLLKLKPVFGKAEINVVVQAVFFDAALINGRWIKLGQEQDGVKFLEFRDDKVVLDVLGERVERKIWAEPKDGKAPNWRGSRSRPGSGSTGASGGKSWGGMSSEDRQKMRDRMRERVQSGGGASRGDGKNRDRSKSGR